MRVITTILLVGIGVLSAASAGGAGAPATPPAAGEQTVAYHVTGLFERDRENALREAVEKIPGVRLVSVDFELGEATFAFDPAVAFRGIRPDKLLERFDQLLRNASGHLLSLRPRCATPRDKLARVEVTIAPLDCKACALAVHEIVTKIDGVEQAAVDMKTGHISALLDPDNADRARIRAALKSREVTLREP
jgi:copper chaperone CopZ